MKKYVKYILVFVCLLLFGFIAFNVYKNNTLYSDDIVYDFVSKIISDNTTIFIKIITWFGSTIGIILMCIFSMIIIRDKKINLSIAICLILGTIINNVLKIVFVRLRPDINPLMIETSYSFPSGHSMMSMILYGYLIYYIYKYLDRRKCKWIFISILSILIMFIGFSRIYLGVHYFSDVIGGFVLGIVYLIIYIDVTNRIVKKV